MKKYHVIIDLNASIDLDIEAENFDDAENKVYQMVWDEDKFIDEHRDKIYIWTPTVEQIIEEE